MRMSRYYLPTLKETPAEAEIVSHRLMLRAGMIRKLSAGIYSLLPLGFRVVHKIEKIIRKEMNKSEAQEVSLPVMQTAEIWKESGRWDRFGPLMIRFEDRKEREYCLGPTHEEVVTELIRNEIRSYKDLPLNLYQIQTKVRDEIRPRFGVMRGREFIMKDAYSMDRNYEGLDESYQIMYKTYSRIFTRCGLETRAVEADTGAMGGTDSHEFMVLAGSGEDDIAFCAECDYAANVERATAGKIDSGNNNYEVKEIEEKHTPGKKTIEELVDFLNVPAQSMIKSLAYFADEKPVLALVRGDDELNEVKLKNVLAAGQLVAAREDEFESYFDSTQGFIGPVNMQDVKIIADHRIKDIVNGITGANRIDYHLVNVNPGRDFTPDIYTDIRTVKEGDPCPRCQSTLTLKSGIEVGHIFKLGTKYSESMDATYLDEEGKEQPIIMGSYGIGVTRLVAAAIEQHHDEQGIIWPKSIAPYSVIIIQLGSSEKISETADNLYRELKEENIDVLLDDRSERAGVKFNDADLIGIPVKIIIGSRSLEKGVVEAEVRRTGDSHEYSCENAVKKIKSLLVTVE
ncbi:MAG: proline--tRNA ligase [Halanaerobiales bacterium]